MASFHIRRAEPRDVPLILDFIKELADYEQLADQVTATEETLTEWLFNLKKAEVVIGEEDGRPVGYALFFYNFSTFLGKAGIYLEDLYVRPASRKKGYGKAFFKFLAQRCRDEGCGRLEWSCLDWNKPSIDFYLSLDAQSMNDWTAYRLNEDSIKNLAES
jgi:GNAT superfamily N-acetyltransferase